MDATIHISEDALRQLEDELETWDWVRTAGVSADELRQTLDEQLPSRELRKAA